MTPTRPLSERERRFVEAFMGEAAGNMTTAARLAGYKHPRQQGTRMLSKAVIRQALEDRVINDPRIATREERQRFLSDVMRGAFQRTAMKDRVKASEVLSKMQGDFIKRIQFENVPPFRLILDGDR